MECVLRRARHEKSAALPHAVARRVAAAARSGAARRRNRKAANVPLPFPPTRCAAARIRGGGRSLQYRSHALTAGKSLMRLVQQRGAWQTRRYVPACRAKQLYLAAHARVGKIAEDTDTRAAAV